MGWWLLPIVLLGSLFFLLAIGMPVGFALCLVGLGGIFVSMGPNALVMLADVSFDTTANFLLIAVPLFILMGEVILFSGIGNKAFDAVEKWLGWLPGGMAVSSVATCTVFGAVTGFSPATTAAIGSSAVPQMLQRGYNRGLATGSIAAGSALAILIPPSVLMVLFGVVAEVSVGRLFLGGFIPGIILSCLFIGYIVIRVALKPSLAPSHSKSTWGERWRIARHLLPVIVIILLVLGTIYLGIATPSEAAALGALGTIIVAALYRELTPRNLIAAMIRTAETTGMLLLVLIGASLLSKVLAYQGTIVQLAQWVTSLEASRWVVLIAMQVLIFILGCFMDPGSILFITTPIFIPIILLQGFDPIWFGIILMINLELATITPPVGLNLYVMKSIAPPEISLLDIIKGCIPFWFLHVTGMALIMAFPQLALWLPSLMKGP
jgi:C4-dicarboxylate transporter DctM subunit